MTFCPSPISVLVGKVEKVRVTVPCGKCMICLQNKRAEWTQRLEHVLKDAHSAYFITLTYSDEFIPKNQEGRSVLSRRDVQLFLKLLRHANHKAWFSNAFIKELHPEGYKPPKIKYFLVGEYGEKSLRPHYHLIIFNLHHNAVEKLTGLWEKGFIKVGTVTGASIRYTLSYMLSNLDMDLPKELRSFMTGSKYLGIEYVMKNREFHKRSQSNLVASHPDKTVPLNSYAKKKIFNKVERENLKWKTIKAMDAREARAIQEAEAKGLNYYVEKASQIDAKIRLLKKSLKRKEL